MKLLHFVVLVFTLSSIKKITQDNIQQKKLLMNQFIG